MRIWTCCLLGFSPTSVGFSNFTRNSISNVRVAGIILLFAITVVLYKKTCTRLQVQTLQEALLQAEAANTSSTQVQLKFIEYLGSLSIYWHLLVLALIMWAVALCALTLVVQGVSANSCRFFDVVDEEVVKDGLKGLNYFTSFTMKNFTIQKTLT